MKERFVVRIDKGRAHDSPHTALEHGLGHAVGMPVHIDESRRPAQQHLGDPEVPQCASEWQPAWAHSFCQEARKERDSRFRTRRS